MSNAKLAAERDIREYLSSIGRTYIRVSKKSLIELRISIYEIS